VSRIAFLRPGKTSAEPGGPPATNARAGVGSAARQVAEHAGAISRLERELAALELKRKATSLGIGAGLGAAAALLALFALGFALATVAAGIATVTPVWLALLIVTLLLAVLVAVLGLLARSRIEKGTPPVPEEAIQEAKLTAAAIRR
jgi:hypothetical protein